MLDGKKAFLDGPQRGKTEWWRYLFGFAIVIFFWFILGSIIPLLVIGFATVDGNPETNLDFATGFVTGINPIINFVSLNMSFVFMLAGLFLVVRFIHQRPFRTLITPFSKINWLRVGLGFGVYLALVAAASLVEFIINPDIYTLTLDPGPFFLFVFFILIFTPLQTSAEELFFRGYLLQTTGHFSKNFLLLGLINGIVFMVPHLTNPEVQSGPLLLSLYFLGIGAFFAYVTLRDNGLELALGAHAANNMFTAVFANYSNSVLPTESIFTVTELNPLFGLLSLIVIALLFYLFFFVWSGKSEKRPAERGNQQEDGIVE